MICFASRALPSGAKVTTLADKVSEAMNCPSGRFDAKPRGGQASLGFDELQGKREANKSGRSAQHLDTLMNAERTIELCMILWALVALWMLASPKSLVRALSGGGLCLPKYGLVIVRILGIVNLGGVVHFLVFKRW